MAKSIETKKGAQHIEGRTLKAKNKFIDSIVPDEKKDLYFKTDVPGLFLRVTPKGTKTWQVRYSIRHGDGWKNRKTSVGVFTTTGAPGKYTIFEAEKKAQEIKVGARSGIDVIAEREKAAIEREKEERQAKIDAAKATTMQELFEEWKKEYLALAHKDKGVEASRWIKSKVLKKYADLQVQDFTVAEFWHVINPIRRAGHNRSAIIVYNLLNKMLDYAKKHKKIDDNPITAADITRKDVRIHEETERDRVLCQHPHPKAAQIILDDELEELFSKLPDSGLSEPVQNIIHLMLSTGARIGELCKAEWKHVNLNKAEWYIPEEVSKNGNPHLIFLSEYALSYFIKQYNLTAAFSDYCFPSPREKKHIDPKVVSRQIGDRQRGANGSNRTTKSTTLVLPRGRWTPHDLRRTAATLMGEKGIPGVIIEKCLNHVNKNKVARIYNRSKPIDGMREAWTVLGAELEKLNTYYAISDDVKAWKNKKVISLR